MKTYATKNKDIKRAWHFVDLSGKILGREATKIAGILIGKNKVYFSPNLDCGDYVVAVNAKDIRLTGRKKEQKLYYSHSGYPGGFKVLSYKEKMSRDPRKIITQAVSSMLPKNKLRQRRLCRLKVFSESEHPYQDKLTTR